MCARAFSAMVFTIIVDVIVASNEITRAVYASETIKRANSSKLLINISCARRFWWGGSSVEAKTFFFLALWRYNKSLSIMSLLGVSCAREWFAFAVLLQSQKAKTTQDTYKQSTVTRTWGAHSISFVRHGSACRSTSFHFSFEFR